MAAGLSAVVMDIRKEKIRDACKLLKASSIVWQRWQQLKEWNLLMIVKQPMPTVPGMLWKVMTKPVILILGGVDKGNDYSFLKDLVKEKVKAIVCMGIDNRKIHEAFGNDVELMVNTQ